MVIEDRRLEVREIVEAVMMSYEWVYHILTEELGMKKKIRKIGAAALDIGPQTHQSANVREKFDPFSAQPARLFAPVCD